MHWNNFIFISGRAFRSDSFKHINLVWCQDQPGEGVMKVVDRGVKAGLGWSKGRLESVGGGLKEISCRLKMEKDIVNTYTSVKTS